MAEESAETVEVWVADPERVGRRKRLVIDRELFEDACGYVRGVQRFAEQYRIDMLGEFTGINGLDDDEADEIWAAAEEHVI